MLKSGVGEKKRVFSEKKSDRELKRELSRASGPLAHSHRDGFHQPCRVLLLRGTGSPTPAHADSECAPT